MFYSIFSIRYISRNIHARPPMKPGDGNRMSPGDHTTLLLLTALHTALFARAYTIHPFGTPEENNA